MTSLLCSSMMALLIFGAFVSIEAAPHRLGSVPFVNHSILPRISPSVMQESGENRSSPTTTIRNVSPTATISGVSESISLLQTNGIQCEEIPGERRLHCIDSLGNTTWNGATEICQTHDRDLITYIPSETKTLWSCTAARNSLYTYLSIALNPPAPSSL